MFRSQRLGKNTGIVFDQVEPEIVLPRIGAYTRHQGGDAGDCRRLPNDEVRLPTKSSRFEISLPIHARRLASKVTAFSGVVLFKDVRGIGVRCEGLCDSDLER